MNPIQAIYRVVPPQSESEPETAVPYYTFQPRKDEDKGLLSVATAALITPAECLALYNTNPNRPQATLVAEVTVSDFTDLGIPLIPDPQVSPAHMLADFRNLTSRQLRQAASILRRKAVIHQP